MKFLIANFLNSSGQYVQAIRVRTFSLTLYTMSPTSLAHSITSDDHTVKIRDCKLFSTPVLTGFGTLLYMRRRALGQD